MRSRRVFIALAVLIAAVFGTHAAAPASGKGKNKARSVTFKVRIENVSAADGQTASDGTRWPFALSPGMYVVDEKGVELFKAGAKAGAGLEAQAEDGSPAGLVKMLEDTGHSASLHGLFNTPVGADAPAPIGPGGVYEFNVTATTGMKLSLVTMFGQSNDYFYANAKPIPLFGREGEPVSGDVTSAFTLYDAGTETDQEHGIGPDQAPRQKAPNTGAAEHGRVRPAKRDAFFARTPQLFRVTITPVG
jgi:hypothetical protein